MKPRGSIWTDEQWQAIVTSGNNMIVSAGAGSGKTAVLTERVIYKLKQGVSIKDIIVLTFTNAAAKEMKERIRNRIKNEEMLLDNLPFLDRATITTFDAYSLSIVKKYHYLLNLKKDIKIIDTIFLKIEKRKILDQIFLEMYEKESFQTFIGLFTNKDDESIKNKIEEIHNKISGVYYKKAIFEKKLDVEKAILEYENLLRENIEIILALIDEVINHVSDEKIIQYMNSCKQNFILEDYRYQDVLQLANYSFPVFPRGKNIDATDSELAKSCLVQIKKYLKELQMLIGYQDLDEIKTELSTSEEYKKVIIQILKEFDDRIQKLKKQYNAFEFNDILFLSIKILTEHKEILDEIKYNTAEIMVDEFQDTNDNNEYFLSLISNHNLYMVGDVKQSIYRFRNANSKIFTDTYYRYKQGEGITIDLNKNFRSRSEVLDNINLIFEHIMDYEIGGVDYDESQKLKFGNMNYQESESNHNLEILTYEYENYKKEFTKDEIEIFMIADDILDKISNHYPVFDIKKKQFRSATYSDFVILLDRKTSFDLYKKIFEYKNIPLVIHKEEDFSYNNVIFVIKNILTLIHSFYVKDLSNITYSLVSVLRSYLFEFDDELILKNIDDLINAEEFQPVIDKITYLATYYKGHSLSELIMETYTVFDMYMLSIKIKNVKENNIKLDYLVTLASNLEDIGYHLQDFIHYFDTLFESNIDISFNIEKSNNHAVNIMTIHKSKGLEFPICYYASLYKEFNVRDVNDSFLYDSKYGIVSPIFKEGIKDTILKKLVYKHYLKEDIEEKIRLFYVALTRAKEKIIMVTNIEEVEKFHLPYDKVVSNVERLSYRSFLDMLVSIKKYIKPYIHHREVYPTKEYELLRGNNQGKLEKKKRDYPYKTVDIKMRIEEKKYSEVYDVTSVSELTVGNRLHEVLEYLDFHHYLEDLENYKLEANLKDKVKMLFKMPFMQDLSTIYKEYQFYEDDRVGIIDLLIETDEKFIIVDYKTKNINKDSYKRQVKNYMDYIKKNTNKVVEGYLYSILDSEYIKVDEI